MTNLLRLHYLRLAEAAEVAAEAAQAADQLAPPPPRRTTLQANGKPVRIAGTPYYLRLTNGSGFTASADIEVAVRHVSPLRIELATRVRTWNVTTENVFVSFLPEDGGGAAQWPVFQEARRMRRKHDGWRIGPAMFRFEIFPIEEV